MDDNELHARISRLVEEEHKLRHKVQEGEITSDQEQARLRGLEVALDQCWDLLRRRRALRASGEDPDEASLRPASEVEGYRQ